MLLEYFTLIFQILIAMPYMVKLKHFMLLDYNYFLIFIVGLALHYLIFFLLLKIKRVGKYLLLFFTSAPYLGFGISLFLFGYKMDRAIIASALENETEMIFYYVNFRTILISIIYIIVMFLFIRKIKIDKKISKIIASMSLFIILITAIFYKVTHNRTYLLSYPIIDWIDILKVKKTMMGLNSQKDKKPFIKDVDELKKHFKFDKKDNINIVLIIGESARSDFFNKYSTVINEENTMNFVKSKSSYFYTREAVPEILTIETEDKNYSPVDIMNALDFNTFWIGAQSINGKMDSPYAHFALNSKTHFYRDNSRDIRYDFELLKFLDSVIKNDGNNFYIIHLFGSHIHFYKRFEEKYAKFKNYCKSDDMNSCTKEELENSYANSIIYTDYFLKEVLKRFKDKNTILFYTSDHSLDVVSINKDEDKTIVPAFLWYNNGLLDKYKSTIENNIQKFDFSHKKIISTLFDCAGIESDIINVKNSICSVDYK